ncbi:hypothetical protein SLA_7244 [Streptomyces laurentii]|uniref:Uncharacterized protein n=1 Tax=Streptomyces laurentii TaxID=39478 RepID=A0A160PAE5_STRLU|nr:hypothetical protein SLA_7244 [Streptomyces laurentii]
MFSPAASAVLSQVAVPIRLSVTVTPCRAESPVLVTVYAYSTVSRTANGPAGTTRLALASEGRNIGDNPRFPKPGIVRTIECVRRSLYLAVEHRERS